MNELSEEENVLIASKLDHFEVVELAVASFVSTVDECGTLFFVLYILDGTLTKEVQHILF